MFKANDKVLCYHGPFLYEATVRTTLPHIPRLSRHLSLLPPPSLFTLSTHQFSLILFFQVLEAENRSGKGSEGVGPHYKVHYKGWKRT